MQAGQVSLCCEDVEVEAPTTVSQCAAHGNEAEFKLVGAGYSCTNFGLTHFLNVASAQACYVGMLRCVIHRNA